MMYYRDVLDFIGSVFGRDEYIKYKRGKLNLLITAPHGGGVKPRDIPDRTTGKLKKDSYTRRLSYQLVRDFNNLPFYVIADIHRSKVDLNRKVTEAINIGDKKAFKIWHTWNYLLSNYCKTISRNYGKGLMLDIHCNNDNDGIQFGYGISKTDFIYLKETKNYMGKSTVDSFVNDKNSLYDVIFGENSLPNSLENLGYKIFTPTLETTSDIFYGGGYNIVTNSGNGMGAIQIEFPVAMLREDLNKLSRDLQISITTFMNNYVY